VKENIYLSAFMRLPPEMTKEEKLGKVDEVIEELRISDVADSLVCHTLMNRSPVYAICLVHRLVQLLPVVYLEDKENVQVLLWRWWSLQAFSSLMNQLQD